MNRKEFRESLKVGDLVYLDPSKVRTSWAKHWANNKMPVEIKKINGSGARHEDTALSGVCIQDESAGVKQFDISRVLSFADELSQIKRESQRL